MRKYLYGIPFFVLAFAILSISVLQSAAVSYVFATPTPSAKVLAAKIPEINYPMPFEGDVLPDSPLWIVKATRDRIWYLFTFSHLKKAELALLFSDKRLLFSKNLFENKKPDIALTTLSKGEKYLEIAFSEEELARGDGVDTSSFLSTLTTASLKHRQIIEESILPLSPEDARPEIVKLEDYSKNSYKSSRDVLNSKGIPAPINPFDR